MCIDFTDLNKACPKDDFPLPRMDKVVDDAANSKMMSLLDCFSGYHQIWCNTRVLDLGINQLMSDQILRLRIELEIDPSSVFELGSWGKPELPDLEPELLDLDPELPEISGYSGPGSLYHTF